MARAGIPRRVLDEVEVEHEVSCELAEPACLLRWEDVRLVGGEEPDLVIDRAYRRFMTTHRRVVEHATGISPSADVQPFRPSSGAPLVAMKRAPTPGAVVPPAQLKP